MARIGAVSRFDKVLDNSASGQVTSVNHRSALGLKWDIESERRWSFPVTAFDVVSMVSPRDLHPTVADPGEGFKHKVQVRL